MVRYQDTRTIKRKSLYFCTSINLWQLMPITAKEIEWIHACEELAQPCKVKQQVDGTRRETKIVFHCCLHSSGLSFEPTDEDALTRFGGPRLRAGISSSESESYEDNSRG